MGIIFISLFILVQISILYKQSFWLITKRGDIEKQSVYENGFNPIGDAKKKFDIIYWIIGLLYLIFDLEIIFIFPFISILNITDSLLAKFSFKKFKILLGLGFVYEYINGALEII